MASLDEAPGNLAVKPPPSVDYALTALGHDVLQPVTSLAMWAFERRHEVEAAREAFDARRSNVEP